MGEGGRAADCGRRPRQAHRRRPVSMSQSEKLLEAADGNFVRARTLLASLLAAPASETGSVHSEAIFKQVRRPAPLNGEQQDIPRALVSGSARAVAHDRTWAVPAPFVSRGAAGAPQGLTALTRACIANRLAIVQCTKALRQPPAERARWSATLEVKTARLVPVIQVHPPPAAVAP